MKDARRETERLPLPAARQAALGLAQVNMPSARNDEVIRPDAPTPVAVLDSMSLNAPQPGLFEDCRTATGRDETLYAPGLYRNHETPPPPVHPPRPLEAPDDLWRALNPGETHETMMGSAQPAGNVGMRDAAFFVTGDVRIGGGARAEADNLRVFAKGGIPGSGDLDWGRPESFGDAGQVAVHLLAEGPGWAAGARTTRVVTARRPRRVRAERPGARRRRPCRRDAAGPDLAGREQDPAQLRHADARRPRSLSRGRIRAVPAAGGEHDHAEGGADRDRNHGRDGRRDRDRRGGRRAARSQGDAADMPGAARRAGHFSRAVARRGGAIAQAP